jgi:hypothetical protein
MSQRETNVLWLRDLLEHLDECRQQLEWSEDPETVRIVTETMLRDLERCRQVCEKMRRRTAPVLV